MKLEDSRGISSGNGAVMWTLRRVLILIVLISSLAVVGTLVWVSATYQRFAIDTQNDSTATIMTFLVKQRVDQKYRQKVAPFIDEWARLSTLINGVKDNAPWKAGIAANQMMQTREVTEGRIRLRNVVVYTKEMKVLAMAEKGSDENLATSPQILKRLKQRDLNQQRHLEAFLWRTPEGRPVHSMIAPVGGFQVFGFIEFVTDPTPELAGMGDAFGGTFKLFDHKGNLLFESLETPEGETEPNRLQLRRNGKPGAVRLETLRVEIIDSIGTPWAVATITRDMSGFKGEIATLRDQAIGIVAGVVLGSILLGWLLLRLAVFSRLRKFASVMETLAQGDTETEIPATGPDEFRTMSTALQTLRTAVIERKRAEEDLRVAKEAAEDASEAKSAFLANMSHELRTPLNAVIGYSELLIETAEEEGWEDAVSDLAKIHGSGKHLLSLINNVLDLSKIEAGKMDLFLETFDVKEMIVEVASTIQPLADQNSNAFEVRCPDGVGEMYSDLTKVRQTLFNLLANACKFTSEGSIILDVSREKKSDGDRIRFAVTDTGIGLSPEKLDAVFDAFFQVDDSTSSEFGGTGLGLAITRSFCLLLGGDVTVESETGKGSTFVVELSADMRNVGVLPRSIDIDMAGEKDAPDKGPTVLVIDDDPLVRDLLRRHLTRQGYHVVEAEGGDEGLRLARENRPGVITLDVIMPKKDGWAVLSALKDDPELADIPVIMLTIVEDRNLGFSLGAADYLSKPINKEKLIGILERHCPTERHATVMVVEDDKTTQQLMRRILEKEGYRVIEAENGRVGLERLQEGLPDLIVLDLMMPEMDGFEFLSHVGKNEAWRMVPVVVMTAKKLTAKDRKRLKGGADLLLEKGQEDLEALLALLKEMIGQRAQPAPVAEESPPPETPPKAKPPATPKQSAQVPIIEGSAAVAGRAQETGHILIVDDLETNRDLLTHQLINDGHSVSCADGGLQALAMADREPFDVILLDLMMPDLNGFEVLARLKADGRTENIPVIMISAYDEQEKAIQCLEIGAVDYMSKPVNVVLLRVRINACIEKKHAQDRENLYLEQLGLEKKNSEELLLNILPSRIVERIHAGEKLIADHFEAVTVLFSDLVDFTEITSQMGASELVEDLNRLFSRFDSLAKEHGVEKVKTMGDAYMVVAGIPDPMPGHMEACADMALGMVAALEEINPILSKPFEIRIGLHTGPVIAGIIGQHKYVYDVWGATVNHASRYESYSLPGQIHISEKLARGLMDKFDCQSRGVLEIRSIGETETFFLKGRR